MLKIQVNKNKFLISQNTTKSSKFTKKSPLQKNVHYNKSNPNYYPSDARVDSNLIESTCIFPETLKQSEIGRAHV